MRNYKLNISIRLVFYSSVGVFLLILGQFFVPVFRDFFRGPLLFLLPFFVFCSLGGVLIFLTIKKKVKSNLRKFLLLAGASAVGFLVFNILHNLFYALEIVTKKFFLLSSLFSFLHGAFFIIAILACPLGFLIGVVGAIYFIYRPSNSCRARAK